MLKLCCVPQDSFAPGASGGSSKYLETASLTPAGVEETKKLLASKREWDRNEGLKRVMAVRSYHCPGGDCCVLTVRFDKR